MRADLYSAAVQAAGSGGLAHRTAAGFLVVTSADGEDMISLIEADQNEPDLIDRIVSHAETRGPRAFAMVFTASGDLYLIASGDAVVTVTSPTARLSMAAMPDHVLIQQVTIGLGEEVANVRLHAGVDSEASPSFDLPPAQLTPVDWAEISIGTPVVAEPQSGEPEAAMPEAAMPEAAMPEAAMLEPGEPEAAIPDAAMPAFDASEPGHPASGASDGMMSAHLGATGFVSAIDAEPNFAAAMSSDGEPLADEPSFGQPAEPAWTDTTPDDIAIAEPDAAIAEPATLIDTAPDDIAAIAEPDPATAEPATVIGANDAAAGGRDTLDATPGAAMVLGVTCPLGHHNHPDASFCTQCGTAIETASTTVLINGPRPALGVLVVDDGTTYSLNEDLIIGREPTSHEAIARGVATPMILSDESLALSRQHARIALSDWTVSLVDLNSSNGTFLNRGDDAEDWAQLERAGSIELLRGDRVRVGGRTIHVELHHDNQTV